MKTRRSKIASDVLKLVQDFFEGPDFKNQPGKVKDYVHWALRGGGPAYYETPIPMLSVLKKGDPNYPVSVSHDRKPVLMICIRNQMAFCARNLFSQ